MKFIELNKNLREKIEPLYVIKGDDYFLVKQALSNLKSMIVKEFEEFNFISLDADKMKKEQVYEQIMTFPMVNDLRLVVLNHPNQEIEKFLNNFDFSSSTSVVLCVGAEHITKGEIIDCSKLDRIDITKYVLNSLKKSNLSIEEQALDFLIDATNSNMSKLVNELNKITAYCVDSELITMDIAVNLVSSSSDYAIYMLTNAIDKKDFSTYQKILNDLTKGQTQGEIFSFMGKYFKRMQYVALSKNDEELAKILNIKPYAIKMSRQNISKNGIKYYLNLFQKYVELDYKIKSGKITALNALYELIF